MTPAVNYIRHENKTVYFQQSITSMHSEGFTQLMRLTRGSFPHTGMIPSSYLLPFLVTVSSLLSFLGACVHMLKNTCSQFHSISKYLSFPFVLGLCLGKVNLTYWFSNRQMWSQLLAAHVVASKVSFITLSFPLFSFPASSPLGVAFDLVGELWGKSCFKKICMGALFPSEALERLYMSLPELFWRVETNSSSSLVSLAALLPAAVFQLWKSRTTWRRTNKGNALLACSLKIIALLRPCNNLHH